MIISCDVSDDYDIDVFPNLIFMPTPIVHLLLLLLYLLSFNIYLKGRDWTWESSTSDETYLRILSLFEDHKCATFSLHIMSQLGVDEGKQIGEWYGPNTVAQVIRWVLYSVDQFC